MLWVGVALILSAGSFVLWQVLEFRRKKSENQEKAPVLAFDARPVEASSLRLDVRQAFEEGVMTNEQMKELLTACGHDVSLDKRGTIVVHGPKDPK
jgi:hypothetical protein